MSPRRHRFAPLLPVCAAAVLLAAIASPVRAEDPGRDDWVGPPPTLPHAAPDPLHDLDTLFRALKEAPDDDTGKVIENRIWAEWLASGSDTVNLLMARAKSAIDKNDYDVAVRLLDAVVEIRPQFVEGWNRRATVFFLKKDYASALADLRQVIRREPRHFGAYAGLGVIFQDIGRDADALAAYRKALEINPRLDGLADKIKTLSVEVEGVPI